MLAAKKAHEAAYNVRMLVQQYDFFQAVVANATLARRRLGERRQLVGPAHG